MAARRVRRGLLWITAFMAVWTFAALPGARADSVPVRLTVQKIRGSEVMGRVAGSFQAAVAVPEGARAVTFYLDGQVVAWATEYPFVFRFDTGDYAKGEHRITAVAHLDNGTVAASNNVLLDFRTRAWQLAVRHSLFLYAGTLVLLIAVACLLIRYLLRIRPRLVLLDR